MKNRHSASQGALCYSGPYIEIEPRDKILLIERNYIDLFHIVVRALRQDYAGARDKAALDDPNPHTNRMSRAMIDGLAFDSTLVFNLNAYLAAFKDRRLRLHIDSEHTNYRPFTRGYAVRRCEEGLFVTHCEQSEKFQPGDEILRLGEFSVAELVKKFGASLYGDIPERELWSWLLESYRTCRVRHADGREEVIEQEKFHSAGALQNRFEALGKDVVCLRLEDFSSEQSIRALLAAHHDEICGCKKLLLDLRRTQGDDEGALIALLPYLFRMPVSPAAVLGAGGLQTMYTVRNCELLKARLNAMLPEPDEDESVWVRGMLADLDAKARPGLQDDVEELPEEWQVPLDSLRTAYDVVLISDLYCCGIAETLLARCHEMGDVTLIGRPSMGELGYCHPLTIPLDEAFSFTYPISRTADADVYAACGVPVHVYIPWTKVEIERDILITRALEI